MLDVFQGSAFTLTSLTDAINRIKFVPGRLGQLGLFSSTSVATRSIVIEERGGILVLVPPTPRGGPGVTFDKQKRTARSITIPHFEINDAIMAEEVHGVRLMGSQTATETVMGKVAERGMIITQSFDATSEYSRIGAIKGIVTYADGSTLNLFDTFGVSQPAKIVFDLANKANGNVRAQCADVIRSMAQTLEGVPFSGLYAQCGDNFFDALIKNTEVRASYLNTQAAAELRDGYVKDGMSYGSFAFGGIMWENYRGYVGSTPFIDPDSCQIFPMGVPGLFRTYHAPADYNETVNTMGRRLYAKQYLMQNDKGVHLDVQMNELNLCTRPNVLFSGTWLAS